VATDRQLDQSPEGGESTTGAEKATLLQEIDANNKRAGSGDESEQLAVGGNP
jgi:hypothetical protein